MLEMRRGPTLFVNVDCLAKLLESAELNGGGGG